MLRFLRRSEAVVEQGMQPLVAPDGLEEPRAESSVPGRLAVEEAEPSLLG